MKAGLRARRIKAWRRGRWAERRAALFLRLKGFRIIARGYKSPVGEIDIVARRGNLLAFVEVKARATLDGAAEALTNASAVASRGRPAGFSRPGRKCSAASCATT